MTVTPIDDAIYETDENVFFLLRTGNDYAIGGDGFANGTITSENPSHK